MLYRIVCTAYWDAPHSETAHTQKVEAIVVRAQSETLSTVVAIGELQYVSSNILAKSKQISL